MKKRNFLTVALIVLNVFVLSAQCDTIQITGEQDISNVIFYYQCDDIIRYKVDDIPSGYTCLAYDHEDSPFAGCALIGYAVKSGQNTAGPNGEGEYIAVTGDRPNDWDQFDEVNYGDQWYLLPCEAVDCTPLAISAGSFIARVDRETAVLVWSVYELSGEYEYVVWHGSSPQTLQPVGSVTSSHDATLSFTHTKPLDGINYYQIVEMRDGLALSSTDIASVVVFRETRLLVYPNPVNQQGSVTIERTDSEPLQIQIVDMQGRVLLKTISQTEQTTLAFSAYPAGVYLLQAGYQTIKLVNN